MSTGAGPHLSSFPYGFANGVSIRGVPIAQTHPGQAFWLYNGTALAPQGRAGSNGNDGSFGSPFATLQGAIDKCVAARGDVIFVKAGHAETISTATALALNKAGVAIIGLGIGASRPTFTLDTINTATIAVSADNISISNCVFAAGFLNLAALFTLTTAKWFTLERCQVKDNSAILNFLKVIQTSTTDFAADGLALYGNVFQLQAASGAVMLLSVNGTLNFAYIEGNYYQSQTVGAGAVIPIAAGKLMGFFQLLNNEFVLVNATGTATAYLISTNGTTNTGMIDGNRDYVLCTSPLPVTASSGFRYGLHYHADTADRCGYLVPAADS